MDVYEALYTTRAMRRVQPDPVPLAARRPVHEVASRNSWDGDIGLEIPEPLWPAAASRASGA